MNTSLFFETILILFAILASNGFIYSLTFFHINNTNSFENISIITNNSAKDRLALTSLIASNPIRLISSDSRESQTLSITSSESSASQTLSVSSSETNVSQTLSVSSSETNVSQDIFDNENWIDSEISEGIHTENSHLTSTNEEILLSNGDVLEDTFSYSALDSTTILNSQSYEEWLEISTALHEFPLGTPINTLQIFKFEELKILYSQDMIDLSINLTELRILIDHLSATSLLDPGVNHLILIMMSYWHL